MLSMPMPSSWSRARLLLAPLCPLILAACFLTPSTGMKTIKPNRAQLETSTRKVVCGSFKPITYSAKRDTPETVRQVRGHNAALGSFKCR